MAGDRHAWLIAGGGTQKKPSSKPRATVPELIRAVAENSPALEDPRSEAAAGAVYRRGLPP
jgi:hypothetical protein